MNRLAAVCLSSPAPPQAPPAAAAQGSAPRRPPSRRARAAFLAAAAWTLALAPILGAEPATSPTLQTAGENPRLQAVWDPKDSAARSWFILAGPGAKPRATVVDFEIRPPSAGASEPVQAKTDPGQPDRKLAISRIQNMISIRSEGYLRFWPIYVVEVNPGAAPQAGPRYNLARVILEITGLAYGNPDPQALKRARLDAPWGFADVLRHLVENPEAMARCFDPAPPPFANSAPANWKPEDLPPGAAVFRFHLHADEPLRILPEHLRQAGLNPAAIDPGRIQLISRGKDVPLLRFDNGGQSFEDGETLVFYGRESQSTYSTERAYWLAIGAQTRAAPMPTLTPPPQSGRFPARPWHLARLRIEEDHFREHHEGDFLSIREVRWLWSTLAADKETSFTFALPGLAERATDWPETVPLTFEFFHNAPNQMPPGAVSIDKRRIRIEVNGHALETKAFSGYQDERKDYLFPSALLKTRNNVARLRLESSLPGTTPGKLADGSFFDALTVGYPRRPVAEDGTLRLNVSQEDGLTSAVYTLSGLAGATPRVLLDVTDPESPAAVQPLDSRDGWAKIALGARGARQIVASRLDRLTSAPLFQRFSPSALRDERREADYLIIAHPDFLDLLQPLIDQKRKQGLRVEVVNVLDIYDEFSFGELSPLAIKEFLLYAARRWAVPPTYVLLVGDANADFRNEARTNVRVFVPAYRLALNGNAEEMRASDHWQTTVLGDDEYPDLIIGRVSVNNRKDAEQALAKAVAATQGPPMGPWRNRVVLVADDEPEFSEACESLRIKDMPPELFVDRLYLNKMRWERNFYIDKEFVDAEDLKVSTEATQAILDAFNRGAAFIGFWGHGSPNIWSDERIWFGGDSPNSDNRLLRNAPLFPFVVNFTCDTGSIDYPVPNWNVCIAEDMMRAAQGGARSLYVPSGPGVTSEHALLAAQLARAWFHDRLALQGDALALTAARFLGKSRETGTAPGDRLAKYIRMYLLLGDPATPVAVPRHGGELAVEPRYVQPGQGSIQVSIASPPFDSGQAVFRLEDPTGAVAGEETRPSPFDPRNRTFTVRLPNRPALGQWTAKAYLWNEQTKTDASAAAVFFLDAPRAEIAKFRVSTGSDGATSPRLNLLLANRSLLPIPGLQFQIREKQGSQLQSIAGGSVDLAPGEQREWQTPWTAAPGLHELTAELANFNRSPDPETTLAARQEIAWANPDPNAPLSFALASRALTRTFRRLDDAAEMEVKTPVFLNTGRCQGPVEVGWGLGNDLQSTATVSFPPGGAACSTPVVFTLRAPRRGLPQPFFIEVDPRHKIAAAVSSRARIVSSMDLSLLPDLAFYTARGGGVAVDPAQPSDGQTVLFRVAIENRGGASAKRFRVAAFDGDPAKGGKELLNRVGPSYWETEGLAAGAQTEAALRWDPKESAGDHRIYFKLDSLDRVLESNKANNVAVFPLGVRTLAKLEQPRIDFNFRELARLRVPITLSVHNSGQTAARNVIFAFFGARQPTPDAKLEEILVRSIEPGQTHSETYIWRLPSSLREDLKRKDFSISASAQIYLKGSLQRIEAFRHSYLPQAATP